MGDAPESGKAVGRTTGFGADHDNARRASHHRRPYSELPVRGGKWPRPVRLLIIGGSAALLWALILLAIRLI